MSSSLLENRHMLDRHMSSLSYSSPSPLIRNGQAELLRTKDELKRRIKAVFGRKMEHLSGNINVLESVSPVQILKRGYSYTTFNNRIVTEAKNLKVGDVIETSFNRGTVSAKVTEVNTDD
jgi:Exonuclease VII, large subunit